MPRPDLKPINLGPGPRDHGPSFITRAGKARLQAEHDRLFAVDRPRAVDAVAEAAAHGDRSENAEYTYGKKKLREIDRRLQFLANRLGRVQVVDPATQPRNRVGFGATVVIEDEDDGTEKTWILLGEDEVDVPRRRISHKSPVGKALWDKKVGDGVVVHTPGGVKHYEIVEIRYEPITDVPPDDAGTTG
jgi:transcription elongation factor GreB